MTAEPLTAVSTADEVIKCVFNREHFLYHTGRNNAVIFSAVIDRFISAENWPEIFSYKVRESGRARVSYTPGIESLFSFGFLPGPTTHHSSADHPYRNGTWLDWKADRLSTASGDRVGQIHIQVESTTYSRGTRWLGTAARRSTPSISKPFIATYISGHPSGSIR